MALVSVAELMATLCHATARLAGFSAFFGNLRIFSATVTSRSRVSMTLPNSHVTSTTLTSAAAVGDFFGESRP